MVSPSVESPAVGVEPYNQAIKTDETTPVTPSSPKSSNESVEDNLPSITVTEAPTLTELIVIYDADGTLAGEIAYFIRKAFFGVHCAACDITHGPRREKPDFSLLKKRGFCDTATRAKGVPVKNIHRDEMDTELRATVGKILPAVVGKVNLHRDGLNQSYYDIFLGPGELDLCYGSLSEFQQRTIRACQERGIRFPEEDYWQLLDRPTVNTSSKKHNSSVHFQSTSSKKHNSSVYFQSNLSLVQANHPNILTGQSLSDEDEFAVVPKY